MRALILAAGVGSRLMPLTKAIPKCMVEYQGRRIIDYAIAALHGAGVWNIAVVGGYLFEVLASYLVQKHGMYRIINNRDFATTNMVYSLFCARDYLLECIRTQEDLIVSYADIVYFEEWIMRLKASHAPLGIVVDKEWRKLWERRFSNPLEDAESLKMHGKHIIELGKKPKGYWEIEAQYTGLFKISWEFLPKVLDYYERLANIWGKEIHTMVMTSFLQGLIDTFGGAEAVVVCGNWMEIDCKNDLAVEMVRT